MRLIDPSELRRRERYELLTSLVVPRPIGWISTWGEDGVANLAPFSYFAALSASPPLVGASIGLRPSGQPKDTLVNVQAAGAFCVNVVSEPFLEAMNATSADVAPGIDEFELAGLRPVRSGEVDAPYVEGCPAVLECELRNVVDLGAPDTLVIGEVVGVLLDPGLPFEEGTFSVDPERLRPVGRLAGQAYALPGEVRRVPRPTLT